MESARADFNLRELPCYFKQYLRNFATFAKIYWRTRFRKNFFCQEYHLLLWQPDFRCDV